MRIGLGEGTIRDAIVWGFLPKVKGIFIPCKSCGKLSPTGADLCLNCSSKLDEGVLQQDLKTLKVNKFADLDNLLNIDLLIPSDKLTFREIYSYISGKVLDAYNLVNDFGLIIKVLKNHSIQGL
jgi:hypothetical protein